MSIKLYYKIVKALMFALEARASYLKGHSERVTRYSMMLGKKLGLETKELKIITFIGKIHDIGKIALSDVILNKKGPLTPTERDQVNLHPLIGTRILANVGFLDEYLPIVRNHHERYDGLGYPDGLRNYHIPLLARIFSVADAYDAMTSDRPYRRKMTKEEAIEELVRNQGTQFDPIIVKAFLSL